ncbi:hypothetical protein D6789_04820 [Candidatus Woesearchaeota archaeon]|nr:MAG: hypothetical protein D6789_04820 [Candidatus Woesearchaeota archaeon]
MKREEVALEFRRKVLHIFFGLFLALAILGGVPLLALLLAAVLFIIASALYRLGLLPFFGVFFDVFEREHERRRVPGNAVIQGLFGAALALWLFGVVPAAAGMLVLAVGDAVAVWGGLAFGHYTFPWNRQKHIEGRLLGVLLSAIALLLFYPFWKAVVAATIALLIESIPLRLGPLKIDDNLTVPLAAALILSLLPV